MTALSLTASGCVVVHGEREVLPATTRAEAAKALQRFTDAYNAADKAYDSSLDEDYVTGALADIDGARLKAGHTNNPGGNSAHQPLKLSDAKFTIPKKAGWPRWFLADAHANKGGDARWLLVFTRGSLTEPFQVAYLTLVAPGAVPEFTKDKDGWAEAVPAASPELAIQPRDLSARYTTYLKNGGSGFAKGAHTSGWRAQRTEDASRPGLATQYIDEPLTNGDYAPLALRTADGGALVFFTTHHYAKQTAAAGASVPTPNQDVQALTKGEIKQSLTLEFVSNEVVLDPKRGTGSGSDEISMLGRIQGLTAARGG
ncbi:putative lipoprotein [Streptomyces brasiliensis]|uniref:Lipoprotein n=2 Tax=Streptomyces brasiliensis TaxID=1954 RepID=A0A917LB43_9ACTN|nr:putative lipoprotein [Streptomyces brasiliensis]